MEPAEQVAANVRRLRKERGLTLEALADAAGLKYSDVGKIETQGREPRVGTIVKLARGLGVPIADLFDGIDVG